MRVSSSRARWRRAFVAAGRRVDDGGRDAGGERADDDDRRHPARGDREAGWLHKEAHDPADGLGADEQPKPRREDAAREGEGERREAHGTPAGGGGPRRAAQRKQEQREQQAAARDGLGRGGRLAARDAQRRPTVGDGARRDDGRVHDEQRAHQRHHRALARGEAALHRRKGTDREELRERGDGGANDRKGRADDDERRHDRDEERARQRRRAAQQRPVAPRRREERLRAAGGRRPQVGAQQRARAASDDERRDDERRRRRAHREPGARVGPHRAARTARKRRAAAQIFEAAGRGAEQRESGSFRREPDAREPVRDGGAEAEGERGLRRRAKGHR